MFAPRAPNWANSRNNVYSRPRLRSPTIVLQRNTVSRKWRDANRRGSRASRYSHSAQARSIHRGALPAQPAVHAPLEPVVGRAVAVALDQRPVGGRLSVELRALPEHLAQAEHLRAVRVLRRLAARVVAAVDRHPLAGHHPGRQPEPEPEEVRDGGVQVQGAVRLGAVQEDRDRCDGRNSGYCDCYRTFRPSL